MQRLLIALLLLTAVSSAAVAQPPQPYIGIYADDTGGLCQADVTQYTSVTVYVCALLPESIPAITACEFRIDNLPTAAMAITTYNWNTPLVIGNAGDGIALAFPEPVPGPVAPLGTISFFPLLTFPDDWRLEVGPSNSSGYLLVVDLDYNEIEADGDIFTFNCTGALPLGCDCWHPYWPVAARDATWGQIKALY